MPSIPSLPRVFYAITIIVAVAFFVWAAASYIGAPGFYYDEVIFAPVSYVIGGQHLATAAVGLKLFGLPVTQQPIYVGALKAWLMAPILAVFGSSYLTLRLPMIVVGALCLAMIAVFLKPRLGAVAAAAAVILAATDPLFIYATKVDWGPTTLAALFRCLALGFLWRFVTARRGSDVGFFLAACAFGFWDKSNFLWLMIAIAVAATLFYRDVIAAWLRETPPKKTALMLLPFVVIYAAILVRVVRPSLHIALPPHPLSAMDYVDRIGAIFRLYIDSASGQGITRMFFGVPLAHGALAPWLAPLQMICAFALCLPVKRFANLPHRRELGFISLVILLIFAQAVATPQTGGPHHMVVFWPLTQIQLVLCMTALAALLPASSPAASLCRLAPFILVAFLTASAVRADIDMLYDMKQNNASTFFCPEIATLSQKIESLNADRIYTVDWGLGNQLSVLADDKNRPHYQDVWPLFTDTSIQAKNPDWLFDHLMGDVRVAAFVSFAQDSSYAPQDHAARDRILDSWKTCSRTTTYVPRADGQPLYRIDLIEACGAQRN